MTAKKSAMFICLGNICRSPIAAAVFRQAVRDRGEEDKWVVESAALGSWHVGNPADYRAQETLKSHNVDHTHRAQQIKKQDFNTFDYIFGMDDENMKQLKRMAPADCKAKVLLLISFDPQGDKTIRDPYFDSDSEGFELCYQQCVRACNGFLDSLSQKHPDFQIEQALSMPSSEELSERSFSFIYTSLQMLRNKP